MLRSSPSAGSLIQEPGAGAEALTPDVEFLVRPGKKRRVLGALDVLILLVRQVMEAQREVQKGKTHTAEHVALVTIAERDRKRRFWERVRSRFNGTMELRRGCR